MSGSRNVLPSPAQELLLRAALAQGPQALRAWTAWRQAGAPLDPGSERLLPLLFRSLERHDAVGSAPPALGNAYRKTWSQNRLRLHELATIVAVLAAEGIDTLGVLARAAPCSTSPTTTTACAP